MNYLLDSNTLSDFYDRDSIGHHTIFTHLSHLSDNTRIFISILSLYEFEYGYANASEVLRPTIRVMLSVNAIYENGQITLLEKILSVKRAKVIITILEEDKHNKI